MDRIGTAGGPATTGGTGRADGTAGIGGTAGYDASADDGGYAGQPVSWAAACYDGAPECIPDARRFTRDFLERTGGTGRTRGPAAETVETAQLVVSELVTNACKYAPGPCLLELELTGEVLEIAVRDSSPELPTPGTPRPDRVGRHGLEIVRALSESFDARREPVGKRVLARLPLHAALVSPAPRP
ncbi:ATP-binding protein [Streptomyces yaizuensis]|uniref:ATP-binding protein n=2 Tax=Streptomyces yaizuensis TaxID=2989713 RepID=A0ABQ5PAQ8_9ACTN|nr:ATP-binding protein [Streptomyces sp. YSPA8]